jgi:sulfite reductase alpha subunit-like flavoprotein
MKPNHARSYSIASCKEVVGSELHIVVGRWGKQQSNEQSFLIASTHGN